MPKRFRQDGNVEQSDLSKRARIVHVWGRRFHKFGKIDALGPAAIVNFQEPEIANIEWRDLRVFFRPESLQFQALRVKPSVTHIYGPEMKVFAIPPAPVQWFLEAENKFAEGKQPFKLEVKLFLEDLPSKEFQPFGEVTYLFHALLALQMIAVVLVMWLVLVSQVGSALNGWEKGQASIP